MKIKKSLVKVILVGSIFFISSMSFGGIISFKDKNLNDFWIISKIDTSFIDTTYAESGGKESGGSKNRSYEKERSGSYKNSKVTSSKTNVLESTTLVEASVVDKKVPVILSNSEKNIVKERINKISDNIDKKYNSDFKKLYIYKRLNTILADKISTLELIKFNVKNEALFEKYEKKILLFIEINSLVQEKILLYINSVDISSNVIIQNQPVTQNTNQVQANNTAQIAAEKAKAEAVKIAADKALAIEQSRKAREKRLAAEAAKIAAEKAKADAIRISAAKAAAQAAEAARANTYTRAS